MKFSCWTRVVIVLLLATPLAALAKEFTVVTYNVENLFDADGVATFDDYKETDGDHTYTPAKFLVKLQNIAKVLKTFNDGAGPDIVCFNEFEIDFSPDTATTDYAAVLRKYQETTVEKMLTTDLDDEIRGLPVEVLLLKYLEDEGMSGYEVAIGQDQPDLEALASNDRAVHRKAHKNAIFSKFPIKDVKSHATPDARDILEATLDVNGHPLVVFVNHWKSRAGDPVAEQARRLNAQTLRGRLDALFAEDPSIDVILAGDFNSHYNQSKVNPHLGKTAVNDVLGSQGDEAATAAATGFSLYNLWHELPPDRRFSDHYDGEWGTLMQMMVTPGLYDHQSVQYVDNSFGAVILDGVNTVGPLKLPRRWTNAGRGAGWSDHFPIAARFRTVDDGDAAKRMELVKPGTDDAPSEAFETGLEDIDVQAVTDFQPDYAKDPGSHIGQLYRVSGKIISLRPLTIEVSGAPYLLHSHDDDLRQELRSFPKERQLDFVGEFALHRGKLQFVIEEDDWILKKPEPSKD
jgi:endonuclease/exonuclease/phosphatase family metal-dependent hydrolase